MASYEEQPLEMLGEIGAQLVTSNIFETRTRLNNFRSINRIHDAESKSGSLGLFRNRMNRIGKLLSDFAIPHNGYAATPIPNLSPSKRIRDGKEILKLLQPEDLKKMAENIKELDLNERAAALTEMLPLMGHYDNEHRRPFFELALKTFRELPAIHVDGLGSALRENLRFGTKGDIAKFRQMGWKSARYVPPQRLLSNTTYTETHSESLGENLEITQDLSEKNTDEKITYLEERLRHSLTPDRNEMRLRMQMEAGGVITINLNTPTATMKTIQQKHYERQHIFKNLLGVYEEAKNILLETNMALDKDEKIKSLVEETHTPTNKIPDARRAEIANRRGENINSL